MNSFNDNKEVDTKGTLGDVVSEGLKKATNDGLTNIAKDAIQKQTNNGGNATNITGNATRAVGNTPKATAPTAETVNAAGTTGTAASTASAASSAASKVAAVITLGAKVIRGSIKSAESATQRSSMENDFRGFSKFIIVIVVILFAAISIITSIIFALPSSVMKTCITGYSYVKDFFTEDEPPIYVSSLMDELDSYVGSYLKGKSMNLTGDEFTDSAFLYQGLIDCAIREVLEEYLNSIENMYSSNVQISFTLDSGINADMDIEYNAEKSIENFRSQPYPYCLMHEDGSYYTIGDFLDSNIPADELNNDLNFAEFLAVMGLCNNLSLDAFNLQDFAKFLVQKDNWQYFLEISTMKVYTEDYNLSLGENIKLSSEGVTVSEHAVITEEDFEVLDNYCLSFAENLKGNESDDDNESSISLPLATLLGSIAARFELKEDIALYREFYIDFTVKPYGLRELYSLADINPMDRNVYFQNLTNWEVMCRSEYLYREYISEQAFLGPSCFEPRNITSHIYYDLKMASQEPTGYIGTSVSNNKWAADREAPGRSAWYYIENVEAEFDISNNEVTSFRSDEIQYDDNSILVFNMRDPLYQVDYIETDYCYKNSLAFAVAMLYGYFEEANGHVPKIHASITDESGKIKENWIDETPYKQRGDELSTIDEIINALDLGAPVLLSVAANWETDDNGTITSKNQSVPHWCLVVGYSEDLIYVYDSTYEQATIQGIQKSEFMAVDFIGYRVTPDHYTISFKVNRHLLSE